MVRFIDAGDPPPEDDFSGGRVAPVIPLFGAASAPPPPDRDGGPVEHDRFGPDETDAGQAGSCADTERELAERTLLRKLRTRSLSVREARAVVAERDLGPEDVEAVIDDFLRRGYLDDAALADQLVHAGTGRRGHGRRAIAQTLAKRGVPRDVADAALGALPDDDEERALEFALTKARSMSGLEPETALRRLTGQLARRGYGGHVAMSAARQALAAHRPTPRSGPGGGVRFD